MSDTQPTEAEREEAQRLLEHIYSLHGFISQKDRMTRQLSTLELNARRKEREDAIVGVILAYRTDAVKAEREKIAILEARISELTKPYKPIYSEPKAYISDGPGLDSYLSDDQEARNGTT